MKVKELFERLQQYNEDTEVQLFACGNGVQEIHGFDLWKVEDTANGKPTLYIEGEDYV